MDDLLSAWADDDSASDGRTGAADGPLPPLLHVVVIGSGVTGLTTAFQLLRARACTVEVWSTARRPRTQPPGWIWEYPPYGVEPKSLGLRWAKQSLPELRAIAADSEANGVAMVPVATLWHAGSEYASTPEEDEDIATVVGAHGPFLRGAAALEKAREAVWPELASCPERYADAVYYLTPAINTEAYLGYLRSQVEAMGGRFVEREVTSLQQAFEAAPDALAFVNCCGLAARELLPEGDAALYACRGQLAHVEAPWMTTAVFADDDDMYAIPVPGPAGLLQLGGTSEDGVEDTAPVQRDVAAIIKRAVDVIPRLAEAPLRGSFAGLRPKRKGGLRLEVEVVREAGEAGAARNVIHSYGHGGSGMTCSWGCARDVEAHVRRLAAGS